MGPHGRSGQVQKISPVQGFDRRTLHSAESRYTIPAQPYLDIINKTGKVRVTQHTGGFLKSILK